MEELTKSMRKATIESCSDLLVRFFNALIGQNLTILSTTGGGI